MVTRARGSRRGSARRGRSPRRRTQWVDTDFNLLVASGSKSETSLLSDLLPQDTQGMTLTRTLVHLFVASNVDQTVIAINRVSMGIGVSDQEAFAAAVLPDPETAGDEPARYNRLLSW